jgi:DNA repair photolyase
MKNNYYNNKQSGCPIGCKYCVVTKVDSRRDLWNKRTIIGLNKAVTIFNPPPERSIEGLKEFYNFPINLFYGDIVGFNAISDPFWPKYRDELDYFLDKVAPLAKLIVCVTKFNIEDEMLDRLAKIKNLRLTVSITGLDFLENNSTRNHLDLLKRCKDRGVEAFPLIHPYIAGLSDLSFLLKLKEIGYDYVDIKGLRYNHENMKEWMPIDSQKYYLGTEEKEVLPEDGWREKIDLAGLKIKSLKDWYKQDRPKLPRLSEEDAQKNVNEILNYANITSSDSDEAVIEASIKRRL